MRRLFAGIVATLVVIATANVVAQAPNKHFMWTVSAPGAPPTYLVGSLHILTRDYYPLSARIEQAFAQSKILIEEVDIDEMTAPGTVMAVMGKALFTDGRTLDQVISPALYKEVIARGEKAGLPAAALQRMKPWLAAVSLTVPALTAAGFNSELGVDKYFFDKAKKAGLERRALETVPYQIDRLDQMAPAVQEAMLKSAIADIDNQVANVKTIADAWARGDTMTIERQLLTAFLESPVIYERMLVERNRNWVEPVETCLKQKTACFVVVGAAHLVGPHSLIALLQKKGYKVEQQ